MRRQLARRVRDLALFNFAIDSKLRGCDLVSLKVSDVTQMGEPRARASVVQRKTGAPVRFEVTPAAREALPIGSGLAAWRIGTGSSQAASGPART